jgi:hypothetical protein
MRITSPVALALVCVLAFAGACGGDDDEAPAECAEG